MNKNLGRHAGLGLLLLSLILLAACGEGGGTSGETTKGNKKQALPPDLVITALSTAPTAVAPGQSISLSSTVTNQGNGPSDYFIVGFHLSTDAIYGNGDDIPFSALRVVNSLAVGESSTDSTKLTVPSSTPPGSYILCVKADDKNMVTESDKTNNTRCLYPLTLQIEVLKHWDGAIAGDGFGFFVKKLRDNGGDPDNPRQDGTPDFIVSRVQGAGGGAVSVYSGKDQSPIFSIPGTGWSYAVDAGDLNHDGVPDLFVGDRSTNSAQAYSGFDGSPLPGLAFNSNAGPDDFGVSVAAIGDINGDGIPDLMVGASGGDYVVLYSGKDGSLIKRIDSPNGNDNFGMSVSAAGDLDGDGTPDFIVGAPGAKPGGMDGAGRAFVFSGQVDANGDFPNLYYRDGERTGDGFGGCCGAIDTVGDLNGDGKMELAVAASNAFSKQMHSAGSIYLFDGGTPPPTGLPLVPSLLLPFERPDGLGPMRFDGEAPDSLLGGSLCGCGWIARMGDLNGDGYPEFMAGASETDIGTESNAGRVLIFSGYDGSVLSRIDNPAPNFIPHYFGVSGANLGDLYGDGKIEVLVGAGEREKSDPGAVYLIRLNAIPKFQVTYPDLNITNVSPDSGTVNAGAMLSVTDIVKNQGYIPTGAFKIGFHLSANAIYGDSDDLVIATIRSVGSLPSGASSTGTTSLTIPSTTPAGSFYVCAAADSGQSVTETNEANNTRCSATTVTVPPPDLVMTAISTTASAVTQGENISLSDTVENQGGSSAGGFMIAFHLSTNAVFGDGDDIPFTATQSVGSLGVGMSQNVTKTLTVPVTAFVGSYYICAAVDYGKAVVEGDEDNNSLCTASTIQVTRPDLLMTQVTPNASSVGGGQTLSVTYTVKNQGLVSSDGFKINYHLSLNTNYGDSDDVVISTFLLISSLSAGVSKTATTNLSIPSNTPPQNYYVCAMADSLNAVVETDEKNNTLCSGGTVTVQ